MNRIQAAASSLALLSVSCAASPPHDALDWNDATSVEADATSIIVGHLSGNPEELKRAADEGGEFIDLRVHVHRTIKGPEQDVFPIRFYAHSESNRHHHGGPSGHEMARLLDRELLIFITDFEYRFCLKGEESALALREPTAGELERTRELVERHAKLAQRSLSTDPLLDDRVRRLLASLTDSVDAQRAGFKALEELGPQAIPSIAAVMDDRRALPERAIACGDLSPDDFGALRGYSPVLVVDGLAAILRELGGECFGPSFQRVRDSDREHAIRAWRVFAQYVAADRVPRLRGCGAGFALSPTRSRAGSCR